MNGGVSWRGGSEDQIPHIHTADAPRASLLQGTWNGESFPGQGGNTRLHALSILTPNPPLPIFILFLTVLLLVVAMHKGFRLFGGYFWAQPSVCGNTPRLTARMARFIAYSSVTLICWPIAETSAPILPCGTEGMKKASFISFTAIKCLSI